MLDELKAQPAAEGYGEIFYPGERGRLRSEKYDEKGIEIVDEIYDYLVSEDVHFDRYHGKIDLQNNNGGIVCYTQ